MGMGVRLLILALVSIRAGSAKDLTRHEAMSCRASAANVWEPTEIIGLQELRCPGRWSFSCQDAGYYSKPSKRDHEKLLETCSKW